MDVVEFYERFLPDLSRPSILTSHPFVRLYLRWPTIWPVLGRAFFIRAQKPPKAASKNEGLISVIIPVYNEGENIQACIRNLTDALGPSRHELLVCYDFDEDNTLPAIESMHDRPSTVRMVRNSLGKGVANALIAGFAAARGDVIVTTMADLSDPPSVIPLMAAKIRDDGADVVSGSRYMPGGSQHGGPRMKSLMSKAAGLSLHYVGGLPTHDATTNFRAYSRRLIQDLPVESKRGFDVGLELTVKAHVFGYRIDEVPSTWNDRTAGVSKFDLVGWLPSYLHWYGLIMKRPLLRLTGGILGLLGTTWLFLNALSRTAKRSRDSLRSV
ncbi:MAG: glycosyl transferase family 2 [Mycobacterium sp.]|nr:MAG: glycosyl transferase family 2 [Mycobacterium sp.]